MKLFHVVAMAQNRVIGKDNKLPWHFPADLKFFKELTTGQTILMGRKTFDSIGRPLPNRQNFVLSRKKQVSNSESVHFFESFEEAAAKVKTEKAFIIGGGEIFKQTSGKIDGIYLTQIHAGFDGDTFYPEIPASFKEKSRTLLQENPKIEVIYYESIALPSPSPFQGEGEGRGLMSDNPLYIKQIEVGPMENFVYLIGDKDKKECVMVDPAWEVDRVIKIAEEDGMKVTAGLVTHTHFDHVNGAGDLIAKTGGKIYVHGKEAEFLKGMKDHIEKTEAGLKLEVGDIDITFIHTPGHTPGSQCFLVNNRLVSGDTLFINACGRCDLPGGNAEQMYFSLQQLGKLGDDAILLPGHNYAETPVSTIGQEKQNNPYYQAHSLSDFLHHRMR
jgi:glyoxylase-like metal-dependent hydrolase (beta-lactamase superfamily II)/dihydrofolate reductase